MPRKHVRKPQTPFQVKEAWNRDRLQKTAAKIGIKGRSKMSKEELIEAIRNHSL